MGLAVKATVAPPAGAAAVNVTVHEELTGAAKAAGLHVNPLSPGSIVTVPPVLDVPRAAPVELAAEVIVVCNWEEEADV